MLRNIARLGAAAAVRRTIRRIFWLCVIGLLVYFFNWEYLSPENFSNPKIRPFHELNFWRDPFQTLVHIGVTSLWVLPVITQTLRIRVIFAAASGLAHLGLSAWFWFALLHEKRVIDGGPLGFLTWTIPTLAGSVAHDWVRNLSMPRAVAMLAGWGIALMAVGYGISCFGHGGHLAAAPFTPPRLNPDMWTMSQRAGSLSYQTFAAGFSLATYALFFVCCDRWKRKSRLFAIFGQNALAAYLLHSLLDVPFSLLKSPDAPLWRAVALILAFLAANALIVAWFNRRRWFLRL
jgi:hypothetical protein